MKNSLNFKNLSIEELKKKILSLKRMLNEFKIKKTLGKIEYNEQIKNIKKNIARANTFLIEKCRKYD